MNRYLLLIFCFFLSGCLLTHKEIRKELDRDHSDEPSLRMEGGAGSKAVDAKETKKIKGKGDKEAVGRKVNRVRFGGVDVLEKFSQIDASLRELRGQIENRDKEYEDRMDQLEQRLLSLIQALDLRVAALAGELESGKKKGPKGKAGPERFFKKAEKYFEKEEWKKAIINYEKYREKNKKGPFYRKSTFQIGLCFQKLEMHKEAKVFFREVLESFPKSAEAKKARKLLSLK